MLGRIFSKLARLYNTYKYSFSEKKGVLIYVGLHKGEGFSSIFRRYRECYAFEANPEFYAICQKRFGKYPGVHIYNVAVADYDGEIEFNISDNDGTSSSIGTFKEDWDEYKSGHVKMQRKIKVPCINLLNFLKENNIESVEEYISDIQGFDLQLLKTLEPYIGEKKIKNITCEVTKDKYGNIYKDLPDNSESGFNLLLNENYECIAKGWGILTEGKFKDVPDDWWEMDCKWKAKA